MADTRRNCRASTKRLLIHTPLALLIAVFFMCSRSSAQGYRYRQDGGEHRKHSNSSTVTYFELHPRCWGQAAWNMRGMVFTVRSTRSKMLVHGGPPQPNMETAELGEELETLAIEAANPGGGQSLGGTTYIAPAESSCRGTYRGDTQLFSGF